MVAILDELITYAKQVYDVLAQAITYIFSFMQTIFQSFPPDNPRRTLWLSMIFLFLVIGIVMIFSSTSWSKEGIKGQSDIKLPSVGLPGDDTGGKNMGNNSGGQDDTINNTTPVVETGVCNSDLDCRTIGGEDWSNQNLHCCDKNTFENYSCAGHCQRISGVSLDSCKHPNECFYTGSFNDHAKYKAGRCDVNLDGTPKGAPDAYCRNVGADQNGYTGYSYCCNGPGDILKVCYGYCMIKQGSSCDDPTACLDENTIQTIAVSEVEE